VKIRHAAGFNHVGTYSKVQDKITVVYNLDGKPTELSFEQDDDNTLVHKTNLGNTPIPLSHPYAKESTTRKKTISKGELLGQWKVRKIVPKNTNFFNIPLDQLFIIVSLTLTFTDDGRIVRSDGEILPDMTTYYFNGDQIFVNGKNALHELTCLNGKPILKLTIDGKTENDSNVWHLWK
jgi:hypothetical protein